MAAVVTAAVAVLVLTVDSGRPPWIALLLAGTFGAYGLLKKLVRVEAAPGLFVETLLLVVRRWWCWSCCRSAGRARSARRGRHVLLLATSGIATAVPLLLFAASTRRIPLSTVGLLQYVTPLMHLAIGVFVNGEPMPPAGWSASPSSGRPGAVHRRQPPGRPRRPPGRRRNRPGRPVNPAGHHRPRPAPERSP